MKNKFRFIEPHCVFDNYLNPNVTPIEQVASSSNKDVSSPTSSSPGNVLLKYLLYHIKKSEHNK